MTLAERDEDGNELVKVLIELPADEDPSAERLWALPLGADRYEIRNVPWYAYCVNWGDIVRCDGLSEEGLPIIQDVVELGGHRTLRIIFNAQAMPEDDQMEILDRLSAMHAHHERHSANFVGIDVEPEADYEAVFALLADQTDAQNLIFEEAWRRTDDEQDAPSWL